MAPQADGHPRQRACPPHHPTPPHPTPLHPNARSQVLKTAEHPGPLTEIDFWTSKRNNLRSIQEQLQGDKIRKVVRVLDLTKSTYFPAFSRLCKEVNSACAEAADNAKFLETLRETFTQLEQKKNGAFAELPDLFRPIMMRLLLVWKNSAHYNTPARLVVLVREVCNELIAAARSFLDSEQIFQLDPSEALERFTLTLKVCGLFKSTYFDFKATSATEVPDNPWKIQNAALFPRLDAFLERCHDLLDLFRTVVQFRKLEKIEIGGNKGRTLSASVVQIYSDFNGLLGVILHLPYDVLDVDVKQFDDDFYSFRASIKELERRLGSVLNQGFEDCATVFSAFKLIESFEGLLEREFIQADLERRQADLLRAYASDLKDVSEIFHRQRATSAAGKYLEREGPPLYVNMPPVAGALFWVRGLIERIEGPMAQLKATMRLMLETEEAKDVTKTYAGLLAGLRDFEATQYEAWGAGVEEISQSKLKQPLLTRDDETLLLHVNFDPALVRLLREVTYFKMLDKDIPKPAAELSEKNETFRVQMGNLQLVAGMYNQMLLTMLDVERPLLAANLKAIDEALAKGLKHLTWKSHAIDDFIRDAMTLVRESHGKLTVLKDNMRSIEAILTNWASNPLIKRKSSKTYNTAEFTAEQATHLQQRYAEVNEGGKEIHKLLLTSNRELKVSKGAPAWRVYVEFVNDIVVDGLARTVSNSLAVVCEQVDAANIAKNELVPWLEVQLELMPPEVQFQPPLGEASGDASVQATVNVWIASFFKTCHIVKRLDRADGDFLSEVAENEDVRFFVHAIHQHIRANEDECNAFREPFVAHEELWTVDINQSLKDFIASGPEMLAALAGETAEAAEGAADGSPRVAAPAADGALVEADTARARLRREPPLTAYDEKISHYKALQDAVATMPVSATRGWLKVDARPAKQALSTWVTKWMFAYTQHLQETIQSCLAELEEFMRDVRAGLGADVETNNVAQLTAAMWHLRSMKKSNDEVDDLFEPLRGMVGLLRKYAIAVPDATVDWLHKAPYEWEDTKKLGYVARERLAPLQSMQAEIIRQEAEIFAKRVEAFVATFKKGSPYTYELGQDTAYDMIDAMQLEIVAIEADAAKISEREALFDLTNHNWRELRMCRTELEQLKTVWDHVVLVEHVFNSYRSVLWARVDCDLYYAATIKIQKQAKLLERTIRPVVGWGVYVGLSATIADMLVALPLVQDLKDEAMRERHWKKLMRICGRNFTMDEKFCLNDLLKLQLHLYADGVSECTEQARQELKIDKQINKIDATWMGLQTEYVPFKNTGVYIINEVSLGGVYEALDENELVLQGMMGNRFMGFFETQIVGWKSKLATVRATLDSWVEVQRAWCSLEAIFIGSEDIREQLPEDAKRFDTVDADFKEQMADAKMQPSPVQACLKEGRMDAMKKCQAGLDLCQKSLSDYLETKRKKFPRFYFISSADLVDVLSKGRNPPAVQEHFSKFTDNIGAIQWKLDDDVPTGTALGMVSGDGEEVRFPGPHTCDGPVEDWLKELMEHVQESLREKLLESVNSYVELPRDKWLGETCAQNSITTSQIWWTTEVGSAFERLEQGNEGALKDYAAQVVTGLNSLTTMVLGELTKGDRTKIKTLITIEVHARDIVNRLVSEKVENALSFAWQSQLKYRWDEEVKDCFVNIADAEFKYSYEYVGNPGRLVITALTDRCYITLTQAMRLVLGGAPAGPAGTGKTETTKDLGRGLAIWVVVQNCSDQMTAKSMANTISGLAQTGAWGCFDEFNRIPIDVLSVVAGQYGSVLDAIRSKRERFLFEDEEIHLTHTAAAFITMNPGYAGRTELPENLKALFRPCAMVVPDFENIIEIELAAEGFLEAKVLSHKFTTLFALSRELLSKQMHYDWGLRAIKGILRIAGGMKRGEPDKKEIQILMRALRDTNLPKFVQADFPIFLGLIEDLFPKVDVKKATDPTLTKAVRDVIADPTCSLQPEEVFINKVVSLYEIFSVRHCVFVLGAAGSAKSQVWQTLARAQSSISLEGGKTAVAALNPKAVTSNELYGYVHPVTKEPYDGIIAKIMRDFSKSSAKGFKWVVLDGDIDAEWIESMNTVMDDNKVLTLVSNERIPLTSSMRLLFEISHMRNASPATASRGGVLYLNESDVGWRPFVQTWVDQFGGDHKTKLIVEQLFDQYVPATLDWIRRNKMQHVTPLMDFAMVETLTDLLTGLLTPENTPPGSEKEAFEAYFQFAAIWSFGGALISDKAKDHRKLFSEWWRAEWSKSSVKFPDEGQVFDYAVEPDPGNVPPRKLVHWRGRIPGYTHIANAHVATIVVPTMDTTRLTFLIDNIGLNGHKPVMLVGSAGSAKTTILVDKLRSLPDEFLSFTINFNSYSDASTLQFMLEQPLEKKTGSMYGPPGTKRLIYLIDDINMPTPDKYGTQSAIALMRQQVDYGGFYDLKKLSMKTIQNVQYVAAQNPTAGSFAIIDRMQRHFATFACPFPEPEVLRTIYLSILTGHLVSFAPEVSKMSEPIVNATIALHREVADAFLPTAIKFHYQWNLRELSAVTQGLCLAQPDYYTDQLPLARLWLHEVNRVYGDRLVNESDTARFQEIVTRTGKNFFEDIDADKLQALPLAFTTFAMATTDEKVYYTIDSYDKLKRILGAKLSEYNDANARMELVLFEQAMEHVCRISRIIDNPRGNALLVGVGGSGKQSLTRLAAFIGGFDVFQIKLTSAYSMNDFKADLFTLYNRAGLKGEGLVFLVTDQQIVHERMLVDFNNILSSGVLPDLYTTEDKDNIINAIRPEVKAAGVMDSVENCWEYFIDKVRANLHVVLCMSPVGDAFRIRCRKFPALTNCTVIDWFHPWPTEALISVALRFLDDVDLGDDMTRENVAHHMSFVHEAVGDATRVYLASERRPVYTTPKSYLELIALYKKLLSAQTQKLDAQQDRLETGLIKLRSSAAQVADMQVQLKDEQVVVEQKKAETDALLVQVGQESTVADEQAELAAIEEEKVSKVQAEVTAFQRQAEAELYAAEPAIKKAEAALQGLDKNSLTELKGLANPPKDVLTVTAAVMYMAAKKGANLKKMDVSWNAAKKFMGSPDDFLRLLTNFDKDNYLIENKEMVRKLTGPANAPDPTFSYEFMKSKSLAAAGLADWVVNIGIYHDIFLDVEPKRQLLEEAEQKLADANTKLMSVRSKVSALDDRKRALQDQLVQATEEKNRLLDAAARTAKRLNLAERLVNGLKDENERWGAGVDTLRSKKALLVGDVMISASFLAYIGPFNEVFRAQLLEETWINDLRGRDLPISEEIDPLMMLTDEATIASWKSEGLPADNLSIQNGTIITNCSRWPLIIDPQLQGVAWIRKHEEPNSLVTLQLTQKNYLDKVERAMTDGVPLLIENLGESVDAVIEPVVSRALIYKGRKVVVKLGDKEVDMSLRKDEAGNLTDVPLFKLYLQTKLPNPHYIPELQAQTTLINFTVTERGLEDQLLAVVVNKERPDLEEQRAELVEQQNQFTIKLKELEDDLLHRLATAEGDILGDEDLIISLEVTKATVLEISDKVIVAKTTAVKINDARETYRPVASRGSLIYFLIDQLNVIDHMYQYSLAAFNFIFSKALDKAAEAAEGQIGERVKNLLDSCTFTTFSYVTRGLFERHRLIFSLQLVLRILMQAGELTPDQVDLLVKAPPTIQAENPVEAWLPDSAWAAVMGLSQLEAFASLPADMEGGAKRWQEWVEFEQPESEALPQEWKRLSAFERLLVVRALRPDRMTLASTIYVKDSLGAKYVDSIPFDLSTSFEDSAPAVPIFFLLSPGVDPVKAVRTLGASLGMTEDNKTFITVSLGQGQEPVAEKALDLMHGQGGWVMLQNIELVARWLPKLEKKLEELTEGAHPDFRVFLSALPQKVVPVPILQSSIKLTNEPPSGLKANMLRAYLSFNESIWEASTKQAELKAIIFSLCFFHSVVSERRKFGPIGWNNTYPFNNGDLSVCIAVANNYLDNSSKVPWDDLRYIFGEIMYGGHITDNKDRRLCSEYLNAFVREELLESLQFFPKFEAPQSLSHAEYMAYVEEHLATETPTAYGLHPNSEINFMTRQADDLFAAVNELQPRSGAGGGGMTLQERVKRVLDDLLERLPELFSMFEIEERVAAERSPYTSVFQQECERMNILLFEMRRSLVELDMGLKGDLSVTEAMESLMRSLYDDRVPESWASRAWPSLRPLGSWLLDMTARQQQLADWTAELATPKVTWISGLFNPQAFLTAVMQVTARKNEWALDSLATVVDVTKKMTPEEVEGATRDGAYIHGLYVEGARWDVGAGGLEDAVMKQLYPPMPVVLVKAATQDKMDARDIYPCPVYKTQQRGPTFVFTAGLRTKAGASKWVLAGVALILDVVDA